MSSIIALIKSLINKILVFLRLRGEDPGAGDDPSVIGFTKPGFIEVVDYYGCPNSKKARKLQLKQKRCR